MPVLNFLEYSLNTIETVTDIQKMIFVLIFQFVTILIVQSNTIFNFHLALFYVVHTLHKNVPIFGHFVSHGWNFVIFVIAQDTVETNKFHTFLTVGLQFALMGLAQRLHLQQRDQCAVHGVLRQSWAFGHILALWTWNLAQRQRLHDAALTSCVTATD